MKSKSRQSGVTLTEMTVVVGVVAVLVAIGLPAIDAFHGAFESEGSVRALISAGLTTARTIAAREQRYAGIRFQKAYNPDDPEQLEASQYMIFIVHDFGRTGLANGFRAVEGLKPIKLSETIGVMDSILIEENINLNPDWEPDGLPELNNLTTFSIIFSPSGKMLIHEVHVRNRDGVYRPANPTESRDDIFNSEENILNHNTGMFIQDDYPSLGLAKERSRNSFIIYDRKEFRQAYEKGRGYSDYLVRIVPETIYINPYTGQIISVD
jgi:prepilin-type N-terminal cleavage/methylation domain-containing protein